MVYTEIKKRNSRRYYYRTLSMRIQDKVAKKREYLGVNLSKRELKQKEIKADKILNIKKETESFKRIKNKIVKILKQHNIKKAGIFGSYARGDYKKNSDIDVLILPTKGMGIGFFGLQIELEEKLRKKVDLVSYRGIRKELKEEILSEEVKII